MGSKVKDERSQDRDLLGKVVDRLELDKKNLGLQQRALMDFDIMFVKGVWVGMTLGTGIGRVERVLEWVVEKYGVDIDELRRG